MNVYQNKQHNSGGLPAQLKANIEAMSGFSMDDVRVHYNSSKPAQMKALAYTQGTDIHVGPGQEKHLGHEAWHVVQQKQGRVAPTAQLKGVNVNTDSSLEHEADVMGAGASVFSAPASPVVQRKPADGAQGATVQFCPPGGRKRSLSIPVTKKEKEEIEKSKRESVVRNFYLGLLPQMPGDKPLKPRMKMSLNKGRQNIHRPGTKEFLSRKNQSKVKIDDKKIQELVEEYKGKGKLLFDSKGNWKHQELILTNDVPIGNVTNKRNGTEAETTVFKIHYSKKNGYHIVPDYPSKKKK